MKKTIELSPDLKIPIDVITQKLAFLGISGSGKTYAAGKLVEELLDAGGQVVIIDTVGNWYGLRSSASGKRAGIAIPILGGDHGDVPLDSTAGREVANLVAESRAPLIVDVSDFENAECRRFVTDFANRLLMVKKKSPSPVMLVWEECQDLVPQRVTGDIAKTVGAVQKLIKKGRNYGVGNVLISQRPAAVNKDVLSQIETLFAFRMNGKHDRKQIEDWIVNKEIDVGEMVDELPSMKTGTCFVWSPFWLEVFEKIRIGKKWTFNATATPEFGEEVKAGKLAPVDLEVFKKTMADAVEKAKAADPEVARKRILQLEMEVHKLQRTCEALGAMKIKPPEARPFIKDAQISKLQRLVDHVDGVTQKAVKMQAELAVQVRDLASSLGEFRTRELKEKAAEFERVKPATNHVKVEPLRRSVKTNGNGTLDGPEQRIINAIAWFESIGDFTPTNTAVAFIAGYSPRGGAYQNPRGRLKVKGFITYGDSRLQLTDAGRALAEKPTEPLTSGELHRRVLERIDGPMGRILAPLLSTYPDSIENGRLAELAGYSPGGGAYQNPRGRLKTLGLIRYHGGVVTADPILFPKGLS